MELSRSEYEHLINEWIFSERDRDILKKRLLDDIPFEVIADDAYLSISRVKAIFYKDMRILRQHI